MAPLQFIEISPISPYALVLLTYVFVVTVRWRIRNPPESGRASTATVKATLVEAGEAVTIILCIWVVQIVMDYTIGGSYKVGGVLLHGLFDYGHLAVLFQFMLRTILRMLP